MILTEGFEGAAEFGLAEHFARFQHHIDPAWIEEALAATGTATIRRRRLPAEQVVWLVVAMALFRNESIEEVIDRLELALPDGESTLVARSAIAQARQRLGTEPLAYLFTTTAAEWATRSAHKHRWRGLSLYAADGTTLRVADSAANREAFGGQGTGRGDSGYPSVRVVGLIALRSHLLSAFRFSEYGVGETELARGLWDELPDDSLTVVDRAYLAAADLTHLERSGSNRHWMTRAKSTTRLRVIKKLGRNDSLVEIELSPATRRAHKELPEVWHARAVQYQRKGFRPSTILTSLTDAKEYPATEIVALYHERWEIEIAYDEMKTHMLAREETIRSRTPAGVEQELWGIALAYNLVRLEMERAADEAGVPPTRISFVHALAMIRSELLMVTGPRIAPGRFPKRLVELRRNLKRLVLPPRREARAYPRAVKLKMSNYPRKRPSLRRAK